VCGYVGNAVALFTYPQRRRRRARDREPVAEPIALGVQIVGHARPFTQLDDELLSESKPAEGADIGPQRIREYLSVTLSS